MSDQPASLAGRSARAEGARRREGHRARVVRRRPIVVGGGVIGVVVGLAAASLVSPWSLVGWSVAAVSVLWTLSMLFVVPDHVRAWETGAEGEACTAALLAPLEVEGFRVLHDRRIPGSRANIDHVVVGPPGVFMVETKSYGGALRVRDGELRVAGRRRAEVIEQAKREASVVAGLLPGTPVMPVICVHRADMPLRAIELDGVAVLRPKDLARRLRRGPARLGADEIVRLAAVLEAQLRPAA